MLRALLVAGVSCGLGCATTEFDRRAEQIAAGEKVIARFSGDDEEAAELRFQLGYLQLEQADALDSADGGQAAESMRERGFGRLDFVINHYPSYSRLGEVRFWHADALSKLHRSADAAAAWRAVPEPASVGSRQYRRWRLAEALRQTGHCDEALSAIEGLIFPEAARERCLCLQTLQLVPDGGCAQGK